MQNLAVIRCITLFIVSLVVSQVAASAVVINELFYNPTEGQSPTYEFIELYNPSSQPVDLSGYSFTEGVFYTFPSGSEISPLGYLLIVRDLNSPEWNFSVVDPLGSYTGALDNQGERLTLRAADGAIVDELTYGELPPWPRGADGYGSSLERVSPDAPADDPHSWRSSFTAGGSPGLPNTVSPLPARPVVSEWSASPSQPRSTDEIQIDALFDDPDESIRMVELQYQSVNTASKQPLNRIRMQRMESAAGQAAFSAVVPPQPGQHALRFNWRVLLNDSSEVRLPHPAEPRPFESVFVYDGEERSTLPVIWMFADALCDLVDPPRTVRGAAVKPLDSEDVLLFDGARIERALIDGSGRKLRFLKGEEFRGDRTLNIGDETPDHPNSGGADTNHKEDIGYQLFRELGVYAPRADWYRVIEDGERRQRLAVQQVNEKFLEINGLPADSDIYKIAYNEAEAIPGFPSRYAKKTNLDEGHEAFYELVGDLTSGSLSHLEDALPRRLAIDEAINYSVAGVLLGNWDGFFNNMFLIRTPWPFDTWHCVPWDLDKTFGYTDGNPPHSTMFVEMPTTYPLDGQARLASRSPGLVSRALHSVEPYHDEYLQRLRKAVDGPFSLEAMNGRVDAIQARLLEDLELEAQMTGEFRNRRDRQIRRSYDAIRTFVERRRNYLIPRLPEPVSVSDWMMY